jgi:dolichol kinase
MESPQIELTPAEDLYANDYESDAHELSDLSQAHGNIEGIHYDPRTIAVFETLGILGILVIATIVNVVLIIMGKVPALPVPDPFFGIYIGIFFGTFITTAVTGGALVTYCGLDVMYSRKLIHFFSFFLPFGLFQLIPFEKSLTTYILTFCATFVAYMPLIEGVRSLHIALPLRLAFASFDREQDRPLTLLWTVSQSFSAYLALMPCVFVLQRLFRAGQFVMIPLMTVAVGDGLAEIVGRKLGRHKYRSRGICTSRSYTRSIEGSLCIFVTCVITILALFLTTHAWKWWQLLVAELTIPLVMTVAEVYAPHAWDNAVLLGTGGILTVGVFCLGLAVK